MRIGLEPITEDNRKSERSVRLGMLTQLSTNQDPFENRNRGTRKCRRKKMGVVGKGFAIVAADTSAVHSIMLHKNNEDKIMLLDSHKLVAASGEPGDR